MSFNYNDLVKLRDNMIALEKRSDDFLRGFLLEMALRALAKTKQRTPVDTGTLRNNWFVGQVRRKGDMLEVDIYNNIEYASHVEYGHKTRSGGFKEGVFMCRLSIDEIQKELPKRWERAFKSFISTLGF
ncbi:MAG: hypothetical protein BWY15_00428 [Firmicutes bacterium ADurb.Bin193]|nr:MAG: hypothetical protein BWY15_00428 [Firmicutes bacterium ADurb.Bin193]